MGHHVDDVRGGVLAVLHGLLGCHPLRADGQAEVGGDLECGLLEGADRVRALCSSDVCSMQQPTRWCHLVGHDWKVIMGLDRVCLDDVTMRTWPCCDVK